MPYNMKHVIKTDSFIETAIKLFVLAQVSCKLNEAMCL